MARIRYLKPEFFSDEDLADLPFQARLAFAGLWCYADKAGRLEDRPKFLKAMIFPYDNIDMGKQLDLLSQAKHGNGVPFIQRYDVDGTKYIQILTWDKHQKPHHTEAESKIPPTPPLIIKGMEKGMEKQLNPSEELRNGEGTVKEPLESVKESYGEFKNVKLTLEEYQKLIKKFGESGAKDRIQNLSEGIASKKYKYSNHYATILSWERRSNPKQMSEAPPTDPLDRRMWEIERLRKKENEQPKTS